MKYICRYKTDVKCDMVRFDTLVKFGKLPAPGNKTIT